MTFAGLKIHHLKLGRNYINERTDENTLWYKVPYNIKHLNEKELYIKIKILNESYIYLIDVIKYFIYFITLLSVAFILLHFYSVLNFSSIIQAYAYIILLMSYIIIRMYLNFKRAEKILLNFLS